MEVFLAADHRGFALKEALKTLLAAWKHVVHDVGASALDPTDDYVDVAHAAAERIAEHPDAARGIFICGSGIGMDVVANKHRGVRAAVVHDRATAIQSRQHGDSNVLVLAADTLGHAAAEEIVRVWLSTSFSGEERHVRRLKKIKEIEERNFR